MKLKLSVIGIIALAVSFSSIGIAAQSGTEQKKPGRIEAVEITIEAVVEAIDLEARKVTLKDKEGNLTTIDVVNQVENLPQVDVGDRVSIDYIEAVKIQVFAADQAEPSASTITGSKGADPGEKPAITAVTETTVVVTIEAIDKENETVTLKDRDGASKTVVVQNPANLEKVVIGDKVMITHTRAIGVSVTEKTPE